MRTILLFLSGLVLMAAFGGCSLAKKLAEKSSPGYDRMGGLLQDSSFEEDGWAVSAPPGYSEYAEITLDDKIKHRGRRSGHVYLRRHPSNGNARVLHAWTQKLSAVEAGKRVHFGGWVRAEAGTTVHLSLRCEFEKPVNGKRYISVEVDQPGQYGRFQFLEKVVVLPSGTTTALSLYAGLSGLGEVWFDDLFVRVLRK